MRGFCTVVAEVVAGEIRILGTGVGPSAGLTKGMVDNIHAAMEAIASSVERAERASGVARILSAYVGIAGPHVSSMNSRGIVAIAALTGCEIEFQCSIPTHGGGNSIDGFFAQ